MAVATIAPPEGQRAAAVMGIYDRDYIHERQGGLGLLGAGGSAVKVLIAVNVAVFVVGVFGGPAMQAFYDAHLAANAGSIFRGFEFWQPLTYAFVHFELFHLFWNMLFLWFVGRELEGIYGNREFLALYLTAAIVSGLIWATLDLVDTGGRGRAVGASGAVAATIVLYAMYYPRREVLLFFVLPVPMWLFVIIFLGGDLMGLLQRLQGRDTEPIAFAAHLSGAAYGFCYKYFDLRWSRLLAGVGTSRRPRLRVYAPDRDKRRPSRRGGESPTRSDGGGGPSPLFADEHLDARLDEILAKIAREGRDALTDDERKVLELASERARNRRGEPLR